MTNHNQTKLVQKFKFLLERIISFILLLFISSCIIGIFILTYNIFNLILPWYICITVIGLLIYKIMYIICKLMTFPGSSYIFRRNMENHFSKNIQQKYWTINTRLESLIDFILTKNIIDKDFFSIEEIHNIRNIISNHLHNGKKQKENNEISSYQISFYELILKLKNQMKNIKISRVDSIVQSYTFWQFLELDYYENTIFSFESEEDAKRIINICKEIHDFLLRLTNKKNLIESFKSWYHDDTFGSIDSMRQNLITRFNGTRVIIPIQKKITLDCLLLEGNTNNNKSLDETCNQYKDIQNTTRKTKSIEALVIFCSANGGIYEFMDNETEWIEFYLSRGINIFLWNYRGYGRSKGSPDPKKLKSDSEVIVDYIRANFNVKKLGVHGESMGGMIATYVAWKKNLDFLCADRTFSSLTQVVHAAFGKFLYVLYNIFTNWSDDSSDNYLDASCYKIITFDPRDTMILIPSSLKYGVTKKIIQRGFDIQQVNLSDIRPKIWHINILANTWVFILRFIYNWKIKYRFLLSMSKFEKYNESLLKPSKMNILYNAIDRIAAVLIEISKDNIFKTKRPMLPSSSDLIVPNALSSTKKGRKTLQIPSKNDDSIENSILCSNSNSPKSDIRSLSNQKLYSESDSVMQEKKTFRFGISSVKPEDKISPSVNEINQISNNQNNLQSHSKNSQNNKPYVSMLDKKTKISSEFLRFIMKIFSIFESMESGGIHLTDICLSNKKNRFKIFKEFIRSLEIWGSYQPLSIIYLQNISEISYFHLNSLNKIKELIKEINELNHMNRQKKKIDLEIKMIEDLEIISEMFSIIYENLYKIHLESFKSSQKISNIFEEFESNHKSTHNIGNQQQLINQNKNEVKLNIEQNKIRTLSTISTLGNLIPLACGHNGEFMKIEKNILDYHLKNSGFLNMNINMATTTGNDIFIQTENQF